MKSIRKLLKVMQFMYDKVPIQTRAICFLHPCFQLQHYNTIHDVRIFLQN